MYFVVSIVLIVDYFALVNIICWMWGCCSISVRWFRWRHTAYRLLRPSVWRAFHCQRSGVLNYL